MADGEDGWAAIERAALAVASSSEPSLSRPSSFRAFRDEDGSLVEQKREPKEPEGLVVVVTKEQPQEGGRGADAGRPSGSSSSSIDGSEQFGHASFSSHRRMSTLSSLPPSSSAPSGKSFYRDVPASESTSIHRDSRIHFADVGRVCLRRIEVLVRADVKAEEVMGLVAASCHQEGLRVVDREDAEGRLIAHRIEAPYLAGVTKKARRSAAARMGALGLGRAAAAARGGVGGAGGTDGGVGIAVGDNVDEWQQLRCSLGVGSTVEEWGGVERVLLLEFLTETLAEGERKRAKPYAALDEEDEQENEQEDEEEEEEEKDEEEMRMQRGCGNSGIDLRDVTTASPMGEGTGRLNGSFSSFRSFSGSIGRRGSKKETEAQEGGGEEKKEEKKEEEQGRLAEQRATEKEEEEQTSSLSSSSREMGKRMFGKAKAFMSKGGGFENAASSLTQAVNSSVSSVSSSVASVRSSLGGKGDDIMYARRLSRRRARSLLTGVLRDLSSEYVTVDTLPGWGVAVPCLVGGVRAAQEGKEEGEGERREGEADGVGVEGYAGGVEAEARGERSGSKEEEEKKGEQKQEEEEEEAKAEAGVQEGRGDAEHEGGQSVALLASGPDGEVDLDGLLSLPPPPPSLLFGVEGPRADGGEEAAAAAAAATAAGAAAPVVAAVAGKEGSTATAGAVTDAPGVAVEASRKGEGGGPAVSADDVFELLPWDTETPQDINIFPNDQQQGRGDEGGEGLGEEGVGLNAVGDTEMLMMEAVEVGLDLQFAAALCSRSRHMALLDARQSWAPLDTVLRRLEVECFDLREVLGPAYRLHQSVAHMPSPPDTRHAHLLPPPRSAAFSLQGLAGGGGGGGGEGGGGGVGTSMESGSFFKVKDGLVHVRLRVREDMRELVSEAARAAVGDTAGAATGMVRAGRRTGGGGGGQGEEMKWEEEDEQRRRDGSNPPLTDVWGGDEGEGKEASNASGGTPGGVMKWPHQARGEGEPGGLEGGERAWDGEGSNLPLAALLSHAATAYLMAALDRESEVLAEGTVKDRTGWAQRYTSELEEYRDALITRLARCAAPASSVASNDDLQAIFGGASASVTSSVTYSVEEPVLFKKAAVMNNSQPGTLFVTFGSVWFHSKVLKFEKKFILPMSSVLGVKTSQKPISAAITLKTASLEEITFTFSLQSLEPLRALLLRLVDLQPSGAA